MAGLNWITSGLSWLDARAVAKSVGGQLSDSIPIPSNLPRSYGVDYVPDVWTSLHRTSTGWVSGDGTPAADPFLDGVDGDGDPNNDALYAYFHRSSDDNGELRPGYASDGASFVISYSGDVTGTEFDDGFLTGLDAGSKTAKLLGGADYVFGSVAGTIDGGAGDDLFLLDNQGTSATIIDGAGRDTISMYQGVIKASLDGEDDYEFNVLLGRVSYENAKMGITNVDGYLYSPEIGRDSLVITPQLNLGAGDDKVSGYNILIGGAGNDELTPYQRAEGGKGNDTLIANSAERVDLRGEDGNDILIFYTEASVSGGKGADKFVFKEDVQVTINDLGAGDKIDLGALIKIPITDALEDGFLKISQKGGYTYGYLDANGGGDQFTELFALKGNYAATIGDYLI